ncbi:MAG: glycoside hydrolase family 16 protein [Flaviramulus sp.]|nr:glycoside hydrolase family 16 protein [Flaviramulus sp.]NNC49727.1 glycoside hydrolase family 16 protein [Flaviramulus sp.]
MKTKIFKQNPIYRKGNLILGVLTIALLVLFPAFTGCTTSETQTVANFQTISMQDEFDVDGWPDSSIWTYDIGNGAGTSAGAGWGNNELQYYTNNSKNVSVQNGYLLITAEKEDFEGSSYTSARILTKDLFEQKYGRFEARIKLPWGQGIWPAFWLLGANSDEVIWPACGEIDIMENRGQEPTLINGSIHGPGYSAGEAVTKAYTLENSRFDTDFHIFGIEWGPGYINYYVDDVLYNQITPEDADGEWVFDDQPFYIIMNVAVGGNYVGSPSAETVFPQTMLVDYVRVYKANLINN